MCKKRQEASFTVGYMPDYFLARHSDILESYFHREVDENQCADGTNNMSLSFFFLSKSLNTCTVSYLCKWDTLFWMVSR